MKKRLLILATAWLSIVSTATVQAQLTAGAQIRTRGEYRNGQGTLLSKNANIYPDYFISQRTRMFAGYTGYRFKTYASIQDVRVWGQDSSTINRTTSGLLNGILVNEAWGEIMLNDTAPKSKIENLSLKIGRQEIAYDDQKILGSLDWLQQARRHDAAVLKFSNKGWTADLGAAYNQNAERGKDISYNGSPSSYAAGTNAIGTMYKSMQYLYLGKKFFFGDASLLCFKDDFSKYTKPSAASPIKNYGNAVWSRITTGAYINATIKRRLLVTASYYHQMGQDKDGVTMDANLVSITTSMQLGRKLFVGPGVDYLSGNDGTKALTASSTNQRFDPLYGTPHKFWGTMDYFYVASGSGKQGLVDMFFKIKYNLKDNLTLLLDVHGFEVANTLSNGKGGAQNPYLGTEVDFTLKYNMTKIINIEAGYSYMAATNSMASAQVKNVANPNLSASWAYVMVSIKPNFLAK